MGMSGVQHPAADGVELAISGMTCSSCVTALTRALSRVPRVTTVQVDLDAGRARVEGSASPEALIAAVQRAGYDARISHGGKV